MMAFLSRRERLLQWQKEKTTKLSGYSENQKENSQAKKIRKQPEVNPEKRINSKPFSKPGGKLPCDNSKEKSVQTGSRVIKTRHTSESENDDRRLLFEEWRKKKEVGGNLKKCLLNSDHSEKQSSISRRMTVCGMSSVSNPVTRPQRLTVKAGQKVNNNRRLTVTSSVQVRTATPRRKVQEASQHRNDKDTKLNQHTEQEAKILTPICEPSTPGEINEGTPASENVEIGKEDVHSGNVKTDNGPDINNDSKLVEALDVNRDTIDSNLLTTANDLGSETKQCESNTEDGDHVLSNCDAKTTQNKPNHVHQRDKPKQATGDARQKRYSLQTVKPIVSKAQPTFSVTLNSRANSKPDLPRNKRPSTAPSAPPSSIKRRSACQSSTTSKHAQTAQNRRETFAVSRTQSLMSGSQNRKRLLDEGSKLHIAAKPPLRRQTFSAAPAKPPSVSSDAEKPQAKRPKFRFVESRIDTGRKSRNSSASKPPTGPTEKAKLHSSTKRPVSAKPPPATTRRVETHVAKRRSYVGSRASLSAPAQTKQQDNASHERNKAPAAVSDDVRPNQQVKFTTPHRTPGKARPQGQQSALRSVSFRSKLNSWLSARGKTPSRYRHLMCFHEHENEASAKVKVKAGLSESELSLQQRQLEKELASGLLPLNSPAPKDVQLSALLTECSLLLDSGCPVGNVSEWLDEIARSVPHATQAAHYWVLRARAVEQAGGIDSDVIDVYEQAVRHHASPPDEVADALAAFVTSMNTRRSDKTGANRSEKKETPAKRATAAPIDKASLTRTASASRTRHRSATSLETLSSDAVFESSSIRYCMAQATPFFTRLRCQADGGVTPRARITPVRRSTRRSLSNLPRMLRDHDVILESLQQLSPGARRAVIYTPNFALSEARKQLEWLHVEEGDEQEGGEEEEFEVDALPIAEPTTLSFSP